MPDITPQPSITPDLSDSDLDDKIEEVLAANGGLPDKEYRQFNTLLLRDNRKRQQRIEKMLEKTIIPRLEKVEKHNIALWMTKSAKRFVAVMIAAGLYFSLWHDAIPWAISKIEPLAKFLAHIL